MSRHPEGSPAADLVRVRVHCAEVGYGAEQQNGSIDYKKNWPCVYRVKVACIAVNESRQ